LKKAKAEVVVAVAWDVVEAKRRPAVPGAEVPATTADDPEGAIGRPLVISVGTICIMFIISEKHYTYRTSFFFPYLQGGVFQVVIFLIGFVIISISNVRHIVFLGF
jgi:hypothetical protein